VQKPKIPSEEMALKATKEVTNYSELDDDTILAQLISGFDSID
jgi:hypothetical protein